MSFFGRFRARLNSGTRYARAGINFIEGAGIGITLTDDLADDEIDVEITADVTAAAPPDATYLTATANATLTNEVVVGTSPGGELGGTWASPTVDTTHSGSSHSGAASSAIATHEAASDPHTGYLKESNTIDFLVGTATGELGGEIVVGATPGGELGGSWASPTVDATHSGSAHHAEDHASRHAADAADPLTFKYKSAAGATISDADYSSAPPNGTMAIAYDSTSGLTYLYARSNGAWKSVELA